MAPDPSHTPTASQAHISDISDAPQEQSDPAHTCEDSVLALLKRNDLQAADFEQFTRNSGVRRSRKVKLAIVKHPRAPRHISLPLLRELFIFDLMNVGLAPAVPPEVRIAAEEALIKRVESISAGERLTLARCASGRLAGTLLLDEDSRVMQAALENPRLTEALILKALNDAKLTPQLVGSVSNHSKWSVRREIRIGLLKCEKLPLPRVLIFARSLPECVVRETLQQSKLPASTKRYVEVELLQQI